MMDTHPASADVQGYGCLALGFMAIGNVANAGAIVSSGGLRRVYAAMEGHRASTSVQVYGCAALRDLACAAVSKARILADGRAFTLIQLPIAAYPDNIVVKRCADDSLANLGK